MAETTALTVRRPNWTQRVQRAAWALRDVFTLRDPALARLLGRGTETYSGVTVSEDSALNISAYFRGVALIAGHIAAMPLIHYGSDGKAQKTKTKLKKSKIYGLLHDQANPEQTAFVFKETLQAHLLTWGNAYAEIEWNNNHDPVGLWTISPDRVSVYRDPEPNAAGDHEIRYRVSSTSGAPWSVRQRDMIHIPGLGYDGLIGYSVIARARQSLGLMVATERYGSTFFGNGASFGGILSTDDDMDKTQRDELQAEIERLHRGPDRAHRFLVLWNGLKYERMAVPPEDAQFLATRQFGVVEMARWLGVPPHKLYDLDRSTFSNIEQQGLEYFTDTLWAWQERWEQELNRKLIPSSERYLQFIEFMHDGILRTDIKTRYDAYNIGHQGGWLSVNEIREKENLNPVPGGDLHMAPMNMIALESFKDWSDSKLNPPKPPAPATPPKDGNDPQKAEKQDQKIRELEEAVKAAETRTKRAEALTQDAEAQATSSNAIAASAHASLDVAEQELTSLRTDALEHEHTKAELAEARIAIDQQTALVIELRSLAREKEADALRSSGVLDQATTEWQRTKDQLRSALEEAQAAHIIAEQAQRKAVASQQAAESDRDEALSALNESIAMAGSLRSKLREAQASERDSVQAVQAASQRTVLANRARERAEADAEAALAEASGATSALEAMTAERNDAMMRVEDVSGRYTQTSQLLETTRAQLDRVTASSDPAGVLRSELSDKVLVLEAQVAADEVQRSTLEQDVRRYQAALVTLEANMSAATERQASATKALEDAKAETEFVVLRLTKTQEDREAAHTRVAELVGEVEAAKRARDDAVSRMTDLDLAAKRSAVEAEQATKRSQALLAEHARVGARLSIEHRPTIKTMRSLVEREIDRAKAAQGSADKMRRWLETFYDGFEETFVERMYDHVATYLNESRRSDDPETITRTIARQHIEASKRDLVAALAGDPDRLTARLEAVAARWRRTRPEDIANRFLQDVLEAWRATLGDLGASVTLPALPVLPEPKRNKRVKKTVQRDDTGRISGSVEEEEDIV